MVEKNFTLPFTFWCLSDIEIEGINVIPLDLSLDLESYWWKVCLFNTLFTGPVIYFDLDIVIQNNFDSLVDRIDPEKIMVINSEDVTVATSDEYVEYPYSKINSSVMCFYGEMHTEIYEKFFKDLDSNIVKYLGLDRYMYSNYSDKFNYLTFKQDWYYRHFDVDKLREYIGSDGGTELPFVPFSKFCIIKQTESFNNPYEGLEEFFL